MTGLTGKLSELAASPPAALRAEWRRLYRAPAPELSADLLARGIAWRLQEQQHGGLPPAIERELARWLGQGASASKPSLSQLSVAATTLRPGTRLVRSWNGATYTVLVTDDGFMMDGQTYASLSSVARIITGTRWSGTRFFGLKGAASARGARDGQG